MLSFIRLVNFKCFQDLRIRCAPLTLLCGLNGVGKSSVMQALLLLSASRGSDCLKLNGTNVELGTPRDVLYEGADTNSVSFELHWQGKGSFSATFNMSKDGSTFVDRDTDPLFGRDTGEHIEGDSMWRQKWESPRPAGDRAKDERAAPAPKVLRVPVSDPPIYIAAGRIGPRKTYDQADFLRKDASLDCSFRRTTCASSRTRRHTCTREAKPGSRSSPFAPLLLAYR